ncbi:MAG: plastocyanin/azurin family copper-binding protein [Lysobacterales bacterium]
MLFACAQAAQAAVYVVTANPDMTFTPADITIHQGDSIRFENAGGLHNVHADDGSFECSLDCSLHNTPNSSPWQVSVRFNRLGTLGYYCDQHGNPTGGMRGSITVIDRVFVDGFEASAVPPASAVPDSE